MKKLLLILLCLPIISLSQWTQTYGGALSESSNDAQQTADGGYIVIGSSSSNIDSISKIWLIKTDDIGDTLWTKTFSSSTNYSPGFSVEQTTDGGYVFCGFGTADSLGGTLFFDGFIRKLDSNGNQQWNKTFGSTSEWISLYDVHQTNDGGYISSGMLRPSFQTYLVKTDPYGNTLWTRIYGNNYVHCEGMSVQQTTDGGYIITTANRYTLSGGVQEDFGVGLIKTDVNGDTLWTKDFGSGSGLSYEVHQTTDGGYILGGTSYSTATNWDFLLIKTDTLGNILWTKNHGGINVDAAGSVQQTTDGGYILAGRTESYGSGLNDAWLVKTDDQGDTTWTNTFGGAAEDREFFAVMQTTDGGYILTGSTESYGNGGTDIWLIKTFSNGSITTSKNTIPFLNANRKLLRITDILGREVNPNKHTQLFYIYDDGSVDKRVIVE